MTKFIKTTDNFYINTHYIILLRVEKEDDDFVTVVYTCSQGDYTSRILVGIPTSEPEIAEEIAAAISNFMQSSDEDDALFCVETHLKKAFPLETPLKLVRPIIPNES